VRRTKSGLEKCILRDTTKGFPRERSRRRARLCWIAVLCFGLSCASAPAWLGGRSCTVVPVSSLDLPASTRLRARVRMGRGNLELGFEAIARNGREELIVVALAPDGTKLFAVRQRGRDIEIEDASSREMKHVALWLMDALHRGFWIESVADSLREDGRSFIWEGERVLEVGRDGHWRRQFRRAGGDSDVAPVVIDYRESPRRAGGAGFEIRNAWCDYEAVVIPLEGARGEAP